MSTFGFETCCIAVLLAYIVSGLSVETYSAVPPAPETSRARAGASKSKESRTPWPVVLVPGVGAGLPPLFHGPLYHVVHVFGIGCPEKSSFASLRERVGVPCEPLEVARLPRPLWPDHRSSGHLKLLFQELI